MRLLAIILFTSFNFLLSQEKTYNSIRLEFGGLVYKLYENGLNVKYFISINKQYSKYKNPQLIVYAKTFKRPLPSGNYNVHFIGIGNTFIFRQGKRVQLEVTPGFIFNHANKFNQNWSLYGLGGYANFNLKYQFKKFAIGINNIAHGSLGRIFYIPISNQPPYKYGYFLDIANPNINLQIKL